MITAVVFRLFFFPALFRVSDEFTTKYNCYKYTQMETRMYLENGSGCFPTVPGADDSIVFIDRHDCTGGESDYKRQAAYRPNQPLTAQLDHQYRLDIEFRFRNRKEHEDQRSVVY